MAVKDHPIEASSLVHHGGYYCLLASFDFCCVPNPHGATYRIMVRRGASPHGPFVDCDGKPTMQDGGKDWTGPGGQTVYIDLAAVA
jgi:arabinan endo-1,5-alpha-L-arabinosidase